MKFSLIHSLLVLILLISACSRSAEQIAAPSTAELVGPGVTPVANPDLTGDAKRPYLGDLKLLPQQADHFALIDQALHLTEDELALLSRNGFVLSERDQWSRFVEAYAWIYLQDLPVLVTTDSILHTVHQSYSDLLSSLEENLLIPQMSSLLEATHAQVAAAAQQNEDSDLASLYLDVDDYLAVAVALIRGAEGSGERQKEWVAFATAAESTQEVTLFDVTYPVDFTLFAPRGHYTESEALERYFRALSWLAHIDFRLVEFDAETNQSTAYPEAIAAVAILRDSLDGAQQRQNWLAVNSLFEGLVGQSDNMTLLDFDRFWSDMQLTDPASVLALAPDVLGDQLTQHDYGQQRITGQLIGRSVANSSDGSIARPVSFMLLGQRFTLESYVLGNLVYDRLIVDGHPVARALPSPLDVMYALGNDRAATHLTDDLAQYKYAGTLAALRQQIDGLQAGNWTTPVYNSWLGIIRSLNASTVDPRYPQALRTAAWADKVLNTQLASWAQLRHDNLLYAKQSFTSVMILCEYPAGYVEPYPAFFAALGAYAQMGQQSLNALDALSLPQEAQRVRQAALDYFARVQVIAGRLQVLAEKELRQEPFSEEEEAFLKSIIKRQVRANMAGCGGATLEEQWDGWYANLFFTRDDKAAVIADVHTNPNNDPSSGLYPPSVLHVATGPVAPLYLLVETPLGTGLFVGPAFTYFEQVEVGDASTPPQRLDDEMWRERLESGPYPQGPAWSTSFRLGTAQLPQGLLLDTVSIPASESLVPTPTATPDAPPSPLLIPTPTP